MQIADNWKKAQREILMPYPCYIYSTGWKALWRHLKDVIKKKYPTNSISISFMYRCKEPIIFDITMVQATKVVSNKDMKVWQRGSSCDSKNQAEGK